MADLTPKLYVNGSEDGTFHPADADNPFDAACAYADEHGLDVGDFVYVLLATERPIEEGEAVEDDADAVLVPVKEWRFEVRWFSGDGEAVMEEVDRG